MPTGPPLATALAGVVHDLREERGLSQEALAERCHIHRNYLGSLERGEKDNPTLEVLRRIAGGLEMDLSALIALAERRAR